MFTFGFSLVLAFTSARTLAQQTGEALRAECISTMERLTQWSEPTIGAEGVVKKYRDEGDADALYSIGMACSHRTVPDRFAFDALSGAVALRPKAFPDAHAVLALILVKTRDLRNASLHAQVALDAGVRLAEMNYVLGDVAYQQEDYRTALDRAEEAVKADESNPNYLLLWSQSLARRNKFAEAISGLERFLALRPDDPDAEAWRETINTLRLLPSPPDSAGSRSLRVVDAYALLPGLISPAQADTKAKIISKPDPPFTEESRKENVVGRVRLRVTLTADGRVANPVVLQWLPHGLTITSLRAAQGIKFTPAEKDGKLVAQAITLEYNFNIY
jgi:tetratricopeptide (TPR) repeat protein